MIHPMLSDAPAPASTADQTLVLTAKAVMGTTRSLAEVAGCSIRVLSEVANGHRGLPTEVLPGVGKSPRELVLQVIAQKGSVAKVHRAPGRLPRADVTNLSLRLTPDEAQAFPAGKDALSAAVTALLDTLEKRARKRTSKPPAIAPLPEATVRVRCRIDPGVLARMNAFLADVLHDTSLAPALLRAAVVRSLAARA